MIKIDDSDDSDIEVRLIHSIREKRKILGQKLKDNQGEEDEEEDSH